MLSESQKENWKNTSLRAAMLSTAETESQKENWKLEDLWRDCPEHDGQGISKRELKEGAFNLSPPSSDELEESQKENWKIGLKANSLN